MVRTPFFGDRLQFHLHNLCKYHDNGGGTQLDRPFSACRSHGYNKTIGGKPGGHASNIHRSAFRQSFLEAGISRFASILPPRQASAAPQAGHGVVIRLSCTVPANSSRFRFKDTMLTLSKKTRSVSSACRAIYL